MGCCKFDRRPPAKRRVQAFVVVLSPPRADFALRISQVPEIMQFQALVSQPTIEALGMPVLHRLSWLDEFQFDMMIRAPLRKLVTDEFRAAVDPKPLWTTAALPQIVENIHYRLRRE